MLHAVAARITYSVHSASYVELDCRELFVQAGESQGELMVHT